MSGAEVSDVLRRLAIVFTGFEGRLQDTPLIRRLTRGRFTLEDYRAFLINLRQQVKEGALWMSRAASNVAEPHLELRSILMRHAVVEHRDFRLLEADYVATGRGAGGDLPRRPEECRLRGPVGLDVPPGVPTKPVRPLGSHVDHRGVGRDQGGGVGQARPVAPRPCPTKRVRFPCSITGKTTWSTSANSRPCWPWCCPTPPVAARIVRTAEVTARLYALQIEEIAA